MPGLLRRLLRGRRRRDGRPPHAAAGRPDVPGHLRGRLDAPRPPRRERDGRRRSARSCGPAEAAGVRPLLRLAARALPARDAELHRPQLRLAARPRPAARAGARPACASAGFGKLGAGGGLATSTTTACSDLQLPVDVRRPRPVPGARPLLRHHLHGLGRGRVLPRGRHARRARRPGRGGREGRASSSATASTVDRIVLGRDRRGRVRGVRLDADGELRRRPTPSCATPTSPSPTGRCSPGSKRRRRARRGHYSPSLRVWHAGVRGRAAGRTAAPQHPLRRASGTTRSEDLLEAGHADARPVDPRDRPRLDDPVAGARPGALDASLYVLEPVPNLDGTLDWTPSARRARTTRCSSGSRRSGYPVPTTSRSRRFVDPTRLGAPGHGARHAVRPVPPFRQTGPFRPTTSTERAPGPGLRRLGHACPASACRWCSSPASSPPSGSDQLEAG